MSTVPNNSLNARLEKLAAKRREVGRILVGLGGTLLIAACIFAYLGYHRGADKNGPVALGGFLFGLAALGCGAWFQNETAGLSGRDSARLFVLILGGALGFALTAAVIWQSYFWWGDIGGGIAVWKGPNAWHVWLIALLLLVGLAVMFASLLLARSEENDSPTLRRLLYGYNALLSGLLLCGILVVVNIFANAYLSKSTDWTKAGIYTLSDKTKQVLGGLQKPVTVIFIRAETDDPFDVNVQDLMNNVTAVTNKVQPVYLLRDVNFPAVAKLQAKYKMDSDLGMLVVSGSGEDEQYTFTPEAEFFKESESRNPEAGAELTFRGEDLLVSAINFLEEGKQKPIVYFTQGNGELDISAAMPGGNRNPAHTAHTLGTHLSQVNYTIQGLNLNESGSNRPSVIKSATVPEDAALVVIAGPTQPFSPKVVAALRKYMTEPHKDAHDSKKERKGKLMVLLDVVPNAEDRMLDLGLSPLLNEFNVEATNERILVPSPQFQDRVLVSPRSGPGAQNPLAVRFANRRIQMFNVREVRPGQGGQPNFRAEVLVETMFGLPVWAESNLGDPMKIMANFDNKGGPPARDDEPLPVAVSVTESSGHGMMNPHAPPEDAGVPRMLVLGNANFVSDQALNTRQIGPINFDFFTSALAWLREKPNSIGIAPKDRGIYMMKENTPVARMIFMPFALMSIGIAGLGLGVWVARRR